MSFVLFICYDVITSASPVKQEKTLPLLREVHLPDDFGYSPALPAILAALGFEMAGISRIDGMYFPATDYRPRSDYPLPGSSAELLMRKLTSADFIWRAPDGSEVLCHWNAHTYFQGDLLAHLGVIRWMGLVLGVPFKTGRHVAKRIEEYTAQLRPLAPTPYLFCPIGCDFNSGFRRRSRRARPRLRHLVHPLRRLAGQPAGATRA